MGGSLITPEVGWFSCAGVVVVGAGAPFDVGGGSVCSLLFKVIAFAI